MAEDKIKLPHLAWEIKSGLDLAEKGKQDRINGLVQAATALQEARSHFKADIRFSKWCTDNEFGPEVLNSHDRAALIAMGADSERMRTLLINSERQSVRYIYEHEWRSPGAEGSTSGDGPASAAESPGAGVAGSARGADSAESRFGYADKPGQAQRKQQFRSAHDTRRSRHTKNRIFTIEEFNLIRMCLHPDGERTEEIRNKAFILFNSKKFLLTGVTD